MKNLLAILGYYSSVRRVIAKLTGFHGLKGEIKLYPLVDDLSVFTELQEVFVAGTKYQVESVRNHKKWVLIKLVGFNDLTSVEHLTGELEAELDFDEDDSKYFIDDLMGLEVIDEQGKSVGQVSNYSSEAQDHIFIKLSEQFEAKSELILPFVEEYILEVKLGESIRVKLDKELLALCQ